MSVASLSSGIKCSSPVREPLRKVIWLVLRPGSHAQTAPCTSHHTYQREQLLISITLSPDFHENQWLCSRLQESPQSSPTRPTPRPSSCVAGGAEEDQSGTPSQGLPASLFLLLLMLALG